MKKIVLILCGMLVSTIAKSQNVIDNFQVGPYEVDYMGKGDVNFRLRKDVNLYEYFRLKKDTVIIESKKDKPVKKAFELGLSYSLPRFNIKGAFNNLGIYGLMKIKVRNSFHLNYGGRIALSYGHYNKEMNNLKDVLFEVGIPLSAEFTKLDRNSSSLFANIGITPVYYYTISAKEIKDGTKIDSDKKNGLYIAPKLETGGYISVNGHLLKIGIFGEYRISCKKENDNIFQQRIGRVFVGANIGYIF